MSTAVIVPINTRSGVVRAPRAQVIPNQATPTASSARMAMAGRLPVPVAVLISAIAIQPSTPVPAASPRIVTSLPSADRIRTRMPMLAMAYSATHFEASARPRMTPMIGITTQKAALFFHTPSHSNAKRR